MLHEGRKETTEKNKIRRRTGKFTGRWVGWGSVKTQ